MTDASSAVPEPPRRRRTRARAPGAPGADESRAHPAGLEHPWAPDAGTGPADPSSADEASWAFAPAASPGETSPAQPMSRRAARRREAQAAEAESSVTGRTDVPGSPSSSASGGLGGPTPAGGVAGSGGLPLRPWWAASAVAEPASLPDPASPPDPGVPAAFLRAEPAAGPLEPAGGHWWPGESAAMHDGPGAATQEPLPREQPQVNPWPGQVRPALPRTVPGTGGRRAQPQRTSDVAPARLGEDSVAGSPADARSLEVAVRGDAVVAAEAAGPADLVLPGDLALPGAVPGEVLLPADVLVTPDPHPAPAGMSERSRRHGGGNVLG
ncbi:MAG: hypothetical protein ACXV0U_06105, partial [Kineosporiaceae bacterium]